MIFRPKLPAKILQDKAAAIAVNLGQTSGEHVDEHTDEYP